FSIGSRGCDVLIDDPLIAPRHLEIVVRATDFVVTPLADTSIDGALITGPTPCRSGQLIGIGDSVLHLEPDRPGDPVALLAVITQEGEARIMSFSARMFSVGRDPTCTIAIGGDPNVELRHLDILVRRNDFLVMPLSPIAIGGPARPMKRQGVVGPTACKPDDAIAFGGRTFLQLRRAPLVTVQDVDDSTPTLGRQTVTPPPGPPGVPGHHPLLRHP